MKRQIAVLALSLTFFGTAVGAPIIYSDEVAYRAALGTSTTYGFETHNFIEFPDLGSELSGSSPLIAADLDNAFDLAFTNLNGLQIVDNGAATGVADGTHYLFSHSVAGAPSYTLTFSNFGNSNQSVTGIGLTITDFASGLTSLAEITFDTGGVSGTLLTVSGGQPDYTQNFIGVTVDDADAFSSITLSFTDVGSGFQDFDEVIFGNTARPVPEPATLVLLGIGLAGIGFSRSKKT